MKKKHTTKNKRKYPDSDVKLLYGRAAVRCAFPDCRKLLTLEKTSKDPHRQLGKIAHIVAHGKKGPRADGRYPKKKLDTYANWVLLCPTCHDKVDLQPGSYSTAYLRKLKEEHETWVDDCLGKAVPAFGFAELEMAVKGIARSGSQSSASFSALTPDQKIAKNKLTIAVRDLLAMGLMRGGVVTNYLSTMDQIDSGFGDRISAGFRLKYKTLFGSGLRGDALFHELHTFASGGSDDFTIRAAGLALLSHLFELCEVFEK